MLTQKNKRSAINRVLSKIKGSYTAGNLTVHIQAQGISFREHDHPGLKEVIAEVRKNISAIAEQVPGSFLNDPDGLSEFEEAVSSILRRMFEEKLGPQFRSISELHKLKRRSWPSALKECSKKAGL